MKDMTAFKVATTTQLERINSDAIVNRRNRSIYTDALDPNGMHVLEATYWLDDMTTCRTQWLIKTIGNDAPVTVFIDVDLALIMKLDEVSTSDIGV